MNVRAISSGSAAIALAALILSGSAYAGPLLCRDVIRQATVQPSCPDNNAQYAKNRDPIGYLFPTFVATSVLADEWSGFEMTLKSDRKRDEQLVHLWIPLWSSGSSRLSYMRERGDNWRLVQSHSSQPDRSVPEPSALLLLATGLVGAALSRRLRERRV
jgi:hypothetical protein